MPEPLQLESYQEQLRRLLPTLRERYSVGSLEIFGSDARHEQQSDSDLDVLVTFSETPGLLKFVALENYLSDTLGIKVNLVMRNALKPRIGEQILKEAVAI